MLGFLRRRWFAADPDNRSTLGAAGERAAARFLRRKGYRLLARNYRCPTGELDLIVLDGRTIVFVEVRTRRSEEDNDPAQWVSPHKWRQVHRVARYYIHEKDAYDRPCRFDLVAVLSPQGRRPQVQHYPEAYSPEA